MGVMQFVVPRREHLADDALERAYFAGMDEVPWMSRVSWNGPLLIVQRAEHDSGSLFIPYVVEGHGEVMLSTASLMERPQPYHLQVELARGTLNRLRNQLSTWESAGVRRPGAMQAPLAAAHEHLSYAATRRDDPVEAARRAELSMRAALDAMSLLSQSYCAQSLAVRHAQSGKLTTLLGVNLSGTRPSEPITQTLAAACNTVLVPLSWREIEAREGHRDFSLADAQIDWARSAGMKICGGPLLSVDRWSLPDWMYLFGADDVDSFRSCVAEHLQAVITRYRGKVHLWVCSAGLNVDNEFGHSEEERLRLAVLSIECIRRVDARAPIVLSIDQPWGAFMGRQQQDLSPLHFADALVRADLGLAGVGLEINVAFTPGGTEPYDPLEFGRQMDRFSTLGLPLLVSLVVPSAGEPDPKARRQSRVVPYAPSGPLTPAAQLAWAEQFLPVLLAKQPVQGIIWNQLLDSQPHALPHGGLFEDDSTPKPLLELLARLRREHLS